MPSKIDLRNQQIGGRHRAMARYYMIAHRVSNTNEKKNKKYCGIEVRVGKEEFIAWFMERDFPGCSVDRIDSSGHYELSNMQVIPLSHNIRKDKTFCRDGTSRCRSCGQTKQVSEFCIDRRLSTGITTLCKRCERVRSRAKYHAAQQSLH